jgi:glycosyltransferase involved in cell wall biosynthesis
VPPRVTVIIATYNWATVLPYSIGSVLDQTFGDFELLVIGDGCTDESEQVVNAIADPRVQWINLPTNAGHQSVPNNEGLRRARGAIVAHLGHDDLWLPRHLERLVGAIDAGATMAYGRVLVVDAHGLVEIRPRPGWTYRPGRWIAPTATAYRRAAVLDVGGWVGAIDETVAPEDGPATWSPEGDLWHRVANRFGDPVGVPQLTCVKLPALLRRNVYRDRPHHEQHEWLRRIRAADDAEEALLAFETDYDAAPLATRALRSLRYRANKIWRSVDRRSRAQRWRSIRRRRGLAD